VFTPGGAGKWRAECAAYLVGATVLAAQDGDELGRKARRGRDRDAAGRAPRRAEGWQRRL